MDVDRFRMLSDNGALKLHLGCGTRHLPDYINIDSRESVNPDIVMDVAAMETFGDDTVDLIYASHVLEHFRRTETMMVLSEWNRILKPNATLRLSVPDFAKIADFYVNRGMTIWNLRGFLMGRQNYHGNTHYVVFDYEFLRWLLCDTGYYDVEHWNPDEVLPEGFIDFSHAREYGEPWSLNVQAKKTP